MAKASSPSKTKKAPAKNPKKAKTVIKNQLLSVIAHLAPMHGGKPPRDLVARRAGYVGGASNPSFKKALSRANQRGHVDLSDKEKISLTREGKPLAGDDVPEVESNKDAQEAILKDLTPKMRQVFEILQDGKPHLRSSIVKQLEYDSVKHQGFKKLLDRMRQKGCLEYVDDSVQLGDVCFPNGRDEE